MQKLGAGAGIIGLSSAFEGMEPEKIQELQSDPEALANYLRQYYSNLNQDATPTQVEEFVQRNMKAGGGRMGYDEGTPPPETTLKENLDLVKETKGGVAPSTTIYMFKMYLDEALEKGQITKEQHTKMLMPFFGETGENVTKDFERYEQKMSNGGRMGYENGTKPLPTLTELLKNKIPAVKMPDRMGEMLKNMTPEEREAFITMQKNNAARMPKRNLSEEAMKKIRIQNEIRKKQAEEMGLPSTMKLLANGGRIMRAYGSDDLVEQASGIEGLDININPKGVKELDLRDSGGFIPPVGVKEKADDIPAMLSNNEFVFTADAVRAAGGGSVNKGAQIMYDTMKKLENGGTV